MTFNDFVKQGKVILGQKNLQKAKALLKMSSILLIQVKQLPSSENSGSMILTLSYSALRQVLEAMCLSQGYKVYSHEAFTHYLKKIGELEFSEKFDRLRRLRNGVEYYGKPVSMIVAKDALDEISLMCAKLRKKYFPDEKISHAPK
jgi:hypothetical protein